LVDALDFPIYNSKMVRAGAQYGKHLYLLKTSEFVKIGRSMDVRRRLGEHRRGNPWAEITLVAVFENSGFVEPWVLKALSQHERRSEWVRCSVPDALQAIGQCLELT
jgi:hypothetical protein